MEVDLGGISRTTMPVLSAPAVEVNCLSKTEPEKRRSSSTPCSPVKQTVPSYQILHMDTNYLVGFATGGELLKLAQRWSGNEPDAAETLASQHTKQHDVGLSRSSRIYKTKNRYYQPYEIPAANGRRRRRMPSSGEQTIKSLSFESSKCLHGPLPICLIKGKRAQSKSLDYLNLDKMNIKESADTEYCSTSYNISHLEGNVCSAEIKLENKINCFNSKRTRNSTGLMEVSVILARISLGLRGVDELDNLIGDI